MSHIDPELPDGYSDAVATLKSLICDAQHRAQRMVNTAMAELYWIIGRIILNRQADQPRASKVFDLIARDLHAESPHTFSTGP